MHLRLPFGLRSRRVSTQAVHIEVQRAEVREAISEATSLVGAPGYGERLENRQCKLDLRKLTSISLWHQKEYYTLLFSQSGHVNVFVFLVLQSQRWQSVPNVDLRYFWN